MSFPVPHIVSIVGAPAAGKTTLVRSLAATLELYDSYVTTADCAADPIGALKQHFRNFMSAMRNIAEEEQRGAVLDGHIASILPIIEREEHHGRLSRANANAARDFAAALMRHLPPPDLVIHLDTSPAACLGRARAGDALALDDHEKLDAATRELCRALAAKGCEVYKRKWDRFGAVNPQRDTVLCAPPDLAVAKRRTGAPPSAEAVECIIQDAWAAVAPARARVPSAAESDAELASELEGLAVGAEQMTPQSPMPAQAQGQCGSPDNRSPVSILARDYDMPTFSAMLA